MSAVGQMDVEKVSLGLEAAHFGGKGSLIPLFVGHGKAALSVRAFSGEGTRPVQPPID